ncbi:MAG: hypothetical protein JSS66_05880 [Armatimonadetes bacterium]|nr:hypothetical protein [Armatimonadota bacterium]
MSLLAMCQELKGVEPYLLTRKEYAVLVRRASLKVIKEYIQLRNQARLDLAAWSAANPEPVRPKDYASGAEFERWRDKRESHGYAWGHEYQKLYNLSTSVGQLKNNVILALMIEDGRYETECLQPNFFVRFGGVNNPLLNHGQSVFTALYRRIDVPEHVLAEWPEGVEQVRKDIAARAAWDKLNPEYAHL